MKSLIAAILSLSINIALIPAQAQAPVQNDYRALVRNAIVQNDLPLAESYARQALSVARKHALTAEDILEWQHQIAQLQDGQGKYAEAEMTLKQELKERQEHYGPTDPLVEHSWNDLFQNLERQRKYAQAYKAALKQFEILASIHGPEYFGMAQCYLDLGRLSFKAGDPVASFDYYTEAISLLMPDAIANCGMLRQANRELAQVQTRLAALSNLSM